MSTYSKMLPVEMANLSFKNRPDMKKSGHTKAQIFKILNEQKSGKKVWEICREQGISHGTFYRWRSKYGGIELNEMKRVKEL